MVKDPVSKTFRCHLALLGLFKDSQGEIVKKVTRDVPVTNSLDNLEATLAGHFIYTHHVVLPPGKYTFEAAVLDRESDKLLTGVKKQSVIVAATPDPSALSMSSLTLVRKLAPSNSPTADAEDPFEFQGGRITPELNEAISGGKGAMAGIYLVAYVQKNEEAKLAIDFLQDGKLVARSEPPMPPPDASGRIHYVANVPVESLKPGPYEVCAKVVQGRKAVEERMFINIVE